MPNYEEICPFERLDVRELVDKPFGKNVIGMKWLWKNKKDEYNTVIRNKVRHVAKGYKHEEEIDFKELFTPVARLEDATPMEKHLNDVKLIFWYLKRTIHMGLWYLKDSDFELIAFSDADHADCLNMCKSTSGGIQFLGPNPGMTTAQALAAIQTMADHSQKWHDGSSSRKIDSSNNSEGIIAIDDPFNEEVKKVEEAKYGEFGHSSPFSNGSKYRVGPPRYYTRIDNRPPFGEKRPSLEELMNKHQKESTRRRAKMEE
ncbi:uncharacterized mitochondrial protein-like protein [Tanacetum coccineum]